MVYGTNGLHMVRIVCGTNINGTESPDILVEPARDCSGDVQQRQRNLLLFAGRWLGTATVSGSYICRLILRRTSVSPVLGFMRLLPSFSVCTNLAYSRRTRFACLIPNTTWLVTSRLDALPSPCILANGKVMTRRVEM